MLRSCVSKLQMLELIQTNIENLQNSKLDTFWVILEEVLWLDTELTHLNDPIIDPGIDVVVDILNR